MYRFLKLFIRSIFPKKVFFYLEPYFRSFLYLLKYKGSNYSCNICHAELNNFIPSGERNLLCPKCGSNSRNRRLKELLVKLIQPEQKVLDFSPSRSLYHWMNQQNIKAYYPTDLSDDFICKHSFDITQLPKEDNYFDLIICYHILEHVIEDRKAMEELHRVLKPKGVLLIQTPFKEGDIYEDFSITTPEDRLIAFHQEDHVRIYSAEGLKERLEKVGLQTEILSFETPRPNALGLKEKEIILKCSK